jgi:hypothetical protein
MTNSPQSCSAGTEDALRKALQAAYLELKKHDAEYHHRTPINVNSMIVDALALTGDAAQPVAWRYRHRGDPWSVCDTEPEDVEPRRLEVQPLYAFQPSPAATVETVKACPVAPPHLSAGNAGAEEAIRDWWYSDRREPMTSKEAAKSLIWYLAKCGLKIIRDEPQTSGVWLPIETAPEDLQEYAAKRSRNIR